MKWSLFTPDLFRSKVANYGLSLILFLLLVVVLLPEKGFFNSEQAVAAGQHPTKLTPFSKVQFMRFFDDQGNLEQSIPWDTQWVEGNNLHLKDRGKEMVLDLNQYCLLSELGRVPIDCSRFIERSEKRYWLGTDAFGRDVFVLLLLGAKTTLLIALIAVSISLGFGIFIGTVAGYFGGVVDSLIRWLINFFWSIPSIIVVVSVSLALGAGKFGLAIGIATVMWIEVANVTRQAIASVRSKDFVRASQLLGMSDAEIIVKHVLPNAFTPIAVIAAATFADAITLEAGLSFLGVGLPSDEVSWGTMVRDYYGYMLSGTDAYLALVPCIAIMLLVLSLVFVSNRLRKVAEISPFKRGRGMT